VTRRRLAVIAVAVLASLGGGTVAAQAGPSSHHIQSMPSDDYGYWYCIGVETIDLGYCQGNPLPDRLPLPEDRPSL
jgi:hypothetical protein